MTPLSLPVPLVSAAWLAGHLDHPALRILDGSWYLPQMGRDADGEFAAGHVPGAQRFDIDEASEPGATYPHTLPTPGHFAELASSLGIGNDDAVVVYDGSGGNLSAGRVWWMFRVFGHDRVAVLDGGWGAWKAQGAPVERGPARSREPTRFAAAFRPALVRDADDVAAALAAGVPVVDMRSRERFEGRAPEPRAGVRGGHMPGARNVPYAELVDASGRVLPAAELRARLAANRVPESGPIICSCGSGVSAGAMALALATLGRTDAAIYDGSWTEWGTDTSRPVVTGPA